MSEIKKRHKESGRIGVFDSGTKDFLRWDDSSLEQPQEQEEMGMGTAALLHGLQGATFGTSDEIIGALNAIPEMVTAPRESGEGLLEKYKRLYKQERDVERAHLQQAEEEAPISSLAGGLAGGFALPGKWLAEGGLAATKLLPKLAQLGPNAAKLAEVAASPVGKMVTGGAEAGALFGAGASEKEDLSGNISDAISGAKGGAVIGGTLGLAGMGVAKVAPILGKLLTKSEGAIGRAYKKGRKGVDILAPEFEEQVSKGVTKEADELSGLLGEEQQKIQKTIEAGEKETFDILDKTRSKVNSKLDDIQDNTIGYLENQKQIQTSKIKSGQDKLQKDLEQKAIQLQKDIDEVRIGLGKEYDEIDKLAENSGVQVNSVPIIDTIIEQLGMSGLTDSAIKNIAKKFEPEYGTMDFKSFQSLKRKLKELFDHADPLVSGTAKKAYGASSKAFELTLRKNNLNDLADQIGQTNRRWTIYSGMDDFVTGTRTQKPFNETFATPKTIKTIEKMGLPEAESISMKKQLETRLPEIMPETAPQRLEEMTKLSQDIEAAGKAKVEVPSLEEALAVDKPYQRQQQLLDELKGVKVRDIKAGTPEAQKIADIITEVHGPESSQQFLGAISKLDVPARQTFIKQFGTTPESIKKKILSLVPATGDKLGSLPKQQEIEDLLKIYSEKFGNEKAGQLKTRLEELAKDVELGRTVSGSSFGSESFTKPGVAKAVAGGGLSALGTKVSNIAGLSVHDFLTSTPGKLLEISAKTSNKLIKDILQQAGTRDKAGRQALLFNLMQNPAYREFIQTEESDK
jgi:hypothetical protein